MGVDTFFPKLCRYFDIDTEKGMDRLTRYYAMFVMLFPIIAIFVYSVEYAREADSADGIEKWNPVDSGPLWIIVSSAFLILTMAYVLIQSYRKKLTADDRAVMYIQVVISLCVVTYSERGAGWHTHHFLMAVPIFGALFDVNGWLVFSSCLVIGITQTVIFTAHQYYSSFLRYTVPNNSILCSMLYVSSVTITATVPMMFFYWLKRERKKRQANTEFIVEMTDLLTMNTSTAAANKKIEEVENELGANNKDAMLASAKKLTNHLANLRSYLPTALLANDADFDDDEDDDININEEVDDDMRADVVEKSNFKRRWSTVLHVCVTNIPVDSAEAERICQRVSEAVIPKVSANRGVVDHLTPNSILATFNCHVPCVIHETEASNCALSIAADLSQHQDIQFCIVVSSGYNLIGSCGVDAQRAKVVIGESVELAMKIPSLAINRLGCHIIVTEDTANKIGGEVAPVDVINPDLPGRPAKFTTLFELRSGKKENTPAAWISAYSNAFSVFRMGDYVNAKQMWKNYCDRNERDDQARRLQLICEKMERTKPTEEDQLEPYVRNELQWEEFEGNFMERLQHGKSQLLASVSNAANSNPAVVSQSVQQNAVDIVKQVREQFKEKEADMEYQEDGLFSMFVVADDEGDGGVGASSGNQNPTDAVDEEVPKSFSDANRTQWQRSGEQIGEGAFSKVYLSLGEQGNLVAMKCFSLASTRTNQEELVQEVDTLSRLRNDYIVGYVSYAITSNHFIILMEYVSGGSLYHLLQQFGALPIFAARRYMVDLLKGLRYLHENGITHCDIKPHNALLSNDGTCKLSDFGSSVGLQKVELESGSENVVRGTSWYIAPEAARGDIQPANDIWSLGITFIEMVTRTQPWTWNKGEANFIVAIGKDDAMVPPLADSIPEDAKEVIRKCCQRDPAQRPTVQQLLQLPFFN